MTELPNHPGSNLIDKDNLVSLLHHQTPCYLSLTLEPSLDSIGPFLLVQLDVLPVLFRCGYQDGLAPMLIFPYPTRRIRR